MRYFKYVGSEKQAKEYSKPNPEVGVAYPMTYYGMNSRPIIWKSEWQEVFIPDNPESITDEHTSRKFKAGVCKMVDGMIEVFVSETIKSFPPDAVTLDTYESGKWYDVREVLPDESVIGRIFVGMWDEAIRQAVWDDKDERFIGIIGDTLDDVALWRAN